jgi:hypothetical protein
VPTPRNAQEAAQNRTLQFGLAAPGTRPPLDCEAACRCLSASIVPVGCLGFFFMERNIAVVGLVCVGLPAAVAFGLRGNVVGFDVDDSRRFTVFQL